MTLRPDLPRDPPDQTTPDRPGVLAAWLAGEAEVLGWLGDPGGRDDAALAAGARAFLAGDRGWDRAALAAILAQAPGDAAAVARLAAPDSVAVVAGQQPAVGGGPLYTLVKTATAIAVAERLTASGVPATALFWCASEDHDLGEAGHADLITRRGDRRRFTAALGGGRASLRFRPATVWWDGLVAHCREHLGAGLGRDWLLAQAPWPEEGMGAWLCRLLATLFHGHGLVAIEGHRLRPLWRPLLSRALDAWPAAALAQQRARMIARGFADPLGELSQPPLFADRTDGRIAVAGVTARTLATSAPDELSPGAALRPVVQQAALPAAVVVLGPGELAYHAGIGPLYPALGVPRPRPWPRPSLTLLPTWVRRGCAAWGSDAATLAGGGPSAESGASLASASRRDADLDAPAQAASGVVAATRPLADLDAALTALTALTALSAAAVSSSGDHSRRLAAGLARLHRERDRLARSLARGDLRAAGRPALGTLQAWLAPRGQGQDRVLSLFQALWEHGPGLAPLVIAAARATAPGQRGWVDL